MALVIVSLVDALRLNPLYLLEYSWKLQQKIQRKIEVMEEIERIVPSFLRLPSGGIAVYFFLNNFLESSSLMLSSSYRLQLVSPFILPLLHNPK